jgi:hypothetical protein
MFNLVDPDTIQEMELSLAENIINNHFKFIELIKFQRLIYYKEKAK